VLIQGGQRAVCHMTQITLVRRPVPGCSCSIIFRFFGGISTCEETGRVGDDVVLVVFTDKLVDCATIYT